MDPWAEAEWLRIFRVLANGKTALIITHHMTTASYAGFIHMMDKGCIIDSFRHGEFSSGGERYSQAWLDQMQCLLEFSTACRQQLLTIQDLHPYQSFIFYIIILDFSVRPDKRIEFNHNDRSGYFHQT
jgi:hypothetical protein